MSLDKLVQIEIKLAPLLERNYPRLTPETGQQCKDLVLGYIALAQTVSDRDLVFVGKMLGVADIIIKSGSLSEGLLEKIYQFNMEGVEEAGKNTQGLSEIRLLWLQYHLLANAGNAAKELSRITKKFQWTLKWYEAEKSSAEISEGTNAINSAYSYGFLGDAARALFMSSGDPSRAIEALECYKKVLDYYKQNPDPKMQFLIRKIEGNVNYLIDEMARRFPDIPIGHIIGPYEPKKPQRLTYSIVIPHKH